MTAPLPDPEDEALKKRLLVHGAVNAADAEAIRARVRRNAKIVETAQKIAEYALELGVEIAKDAVLGLVSEELEKRGLR